MRLLATIGVFCLLGALLADEGKKEPAEGKKDSAKIREVGLKAVGQPMGKVTDPLVIDNVGDLKKNITGEEAQAAVLKNLDFAKEKVLLFGWSGSGRDMVTATEEKGEVIFTYKAGLTRDLRGHTKVFIIPKDAKFKVVTGK